MGHLNVPGISPGQVVFMDHTAMGSGESDTDYRGFHSFFVKTRGDGLYLSSKLITG